MTTPTKLDSGDGTRLTVTFKNSAGVETDPATVKFHALKPDGTAIDYVYGTDAELVKAAVGIYYVELVHAGAGDWVREFHGSGNGIEAVTVSLARVTASLSVPG